MHPTGVVANLSVADLAEARDFYVDFLCLSVEGFNLGWVVNLQSPDGRAVVQSEWTLVRMAGLTFLPVPATVGIAVPGV